MGLFDGIFGKKKHVVVNGIPKSGMYKDFLEIKAIDDRILVELAREVLKKNASTEIKADDDGYIGVTIYVPDGTTVRLCIDRLKVYDKNGKLFKEVLADDKNREHVKVVLVEDPDEEAFNHGIRFLKQNKFSEAVPCFRKAISLNPIDPNYHYNLGVALYALGDLVGAKKEYEFVLNKHPEDIDALNNLGTIYMITGDRKRAKDLYDQALKFNSDFALTHRNLAAYYQGIGDKALLKVHKKRALELDKDIFK